MVNKQRQDISGTYEKTKYSCSAEGCRNKMTFKDILLYIHTYISVFDQPSAQMLPASVDGKKHIDPLLDNLQSGKGLGKLSPK